MTRTIVFSVVPELARASSPRETVEKTDSRSSTPASAPWLALPVSSLIGTEYSRDSAEDGRVPVFWTTAVPCDFQTRSSGCGKSAGAELVVFQFSHCVLLVPNQSGRRFRSNSARL